MPTDPYDWWRNALRGEVGPIHEDQPQPGFYRTKMRKDGPLVPVAIWWAGPEEEDQHLMAVAGHECAEIDPYDRWVFIAKRPISEQNYRHYMDHKKWLDIDDAIEVTPDKSPQQLLEKLDQAMEYIKRYDVINDDATERLAQTARSRLLKLSKEADDERAAEKKPHFEAAKAVDGLWMPIVKGFKSAADAIARSMADYEQRKADKAFKDRRNEPLPTKVAGGDGRAATIKVVQVVTEVEDWDAACAFLLSQPHYKFQLMEMVQHAVTAGHKVPGVKVEDRRKIS